LPNGWELNKRAGFLEGEAIGISLPIGLQTNRRLFKRWSKFADTGQANSAVGLLVAHFKKTAPLEFMRSVRPKADTETRPSFLLSSVSKNESQKG
jgi:hypothetical protein